MRRRKRRRRPFAEHAQLGVRLLPRDARSEPADDVDRAALERTVRGAELQWRPGLVVDGIPETIRHDADHGGWCVPQLHDRADDVVPTAEGAVPRVVSEHDHAGGSGHLVRVEQRTTEQRRHTCRAERGGRHLRYLDQIGSRVADDEISGVRAVGSQVLDRSQLAPPFEEVTHDACLGLVGQRILRLDHDKAVAFGERDRWRLDLAHEVVRARANPDREGERQPASDRQARVLQEHPESELVILQHVSSLLRVNPIRRSPASRPSRGSASAG